MPWGYKMRDERRTVNALQITVDADQHTACFYGEQMKGMTQTAWMFSPQFNHGR